MSHDSRAFRNALGHFATGVCVITAQGSDGEAVGVTVNSFASVSLDPPLVLWSLDRASDRFPVFMASDHFCVNVLDGRAQHLSHRLSRKGERSIADEPCAKGKTALPILQDALAHFECKVEARHDGGDHVIFVGRVLSFDFKEGGDPLLFYRGRYRSLSGES
ncbi:MAG: flavin reductase [Alphaproteobacteria bacterium]|nr:flavin reductase [Alphaproteobacteria bacterium]